MLQQLNCLANKLNLNTDVNNKNNYYISMISTFINDNE